ncbi:hypothetical protein HPB48_024783 [Haemaphysalis longicornis]|uniref:Uncharacterized protein n=1 Tax=Haemaphysalis longicornis TaxID=44386 RepID=A0A9J6H930_HAELO|nr:hypothetical protein HPB48_024783 [Haemaphysalis longicornis]
MEVDLVAGVRCKKLAWLCVTRQETRRARSEGLRSYMKAAQSQGWGALSGVFCGNAQHILGGGAEGCLERVESGRGVACLKTEGLVRHRSARSVVIAMGRRRALAQQAKLAQLDKTKSRKMKGLCGFAPVSHPVVHGFGAVPMYVAAPGNAVGYAPPPPSLVHPPPPPLLTSHPPGLLDSSGGLPPWPVAPPDGKETLLFYRAPISGWGTPSFVPRCVAAVSFYDLDLVPVVGSRVEANRRACVCPAVGVEERRTFRPLCVRRYGRLGMGPPPKLGFSAWRRTYLFGDGTALARFLTLLLAAVSPCWLRLYPFPPAPCREGELRSSSVEER